MTPAADPDPVIRSIAAWVWRFRRAVIVLAVLGASYATLYRWLDNYDVPRVLAASDPYRAPETRWRLVNERMPDDAEGLYYVPGVGILPVTIDARWTDVIDGCVTSLLQDRLNTWTQKADLVQLPLLPPFVHLSAKAVEPDIDLMIYSPDGLAVDLRTDRGGWAATQRPHNGGGGQPTGVLPDEARAVITRFADENGLTTSSVTLPIRSPEYKNAVRAESSTVLAARDGVTIAVAAVASWPGGTAVRLEGWTDDPHDVVLLGLDVEPGWGGEGYDNDDDLTADPNGAVVLRDGRGRMLPLRNGGRLAERRAPFEWVSWLGQGLGTKPGIDLPATLLFDALPADTNALSLSVGPIRVAHDMLLPEDADRPAEGEARETLTIPVPEDAPERVSEYAGRYTVGFAVPLDDVPLTLAGAHVAARSARFVPDGDVEIELQNDSAPANRRLVDVFGVSERWRRTDGMYYRFNGNRGNRMALDVSAHPSVRVVVHGGLTWPAARATAFATAGAAAGPGDIHWPPRDARPITVALVRPVVELAGRWRFEVPMDVLRANAAVNAGIDGNTH